MRHFISPTLLPARLIVISIAAILPLSCESTGRPKPLIQQLDLALPDRTGLALTLAANDLRDAVKKITGQAGTGEAMLRISVTSDYTAALGTDGYRFREESDGWRIEAATDIGAAYGIYAFLNAAGVVYHHPEETFFPQDPNHPMPSLLPFEDQTPDFEFRGFHHHTQHPIITSDDMLRPALDGGRERLRNQMRWLLRNRQNAWSFHGLNTIELEAWLPHIAEVVAEADQHGVRLGMALSFADQQQHNFKLIQSLGADEETQIAERLDMLLGTGLSFLTFQIGTSEFTQPPEGSVIRWLDFAAHYMSQHFPNARPYTWVHITCDLDTSSGDHFFHQSLGADMGMGAWVHTTMFYTLTDPAPVYDCIDFSHQLDYLAAADGNREQVFFPETAWWLGFDNNVPLHMPITGISRERDIKDILANYDVTGHITFTTGREWLYWSYDHYLTMSTWNGEFAWADYLQMIAPIYGTHGAIVADVINDWTALQVTHLYDQNPRIHFYLSGELPQDEVGARAGIIARPPKLALETVLAFDDAEYERWYSEDYTLLESMRMAYGALFERLPRPSSRPTDLPTTLYDEVVATLELSIHRIDHALAIYGGAIAVRDNQEEEARAHLEAAKEISARVIERVADREAYYRYPLELLAEEKPESLTAYPFGYLHETRTGFFWTRRDTQLERLIEAKFSPMVEAWSGAPQGFFVSSGMDLILVEPMSSVGAEPLKSFIPTFLFATEPWDGVDGYAIHLAQDGNGNGDPDFQTELVIVSAEDSPWRGQFRSYPVVVNGTSGDVLGILNLYDGVLSGTPEIDNGLPTSLGVFRLSVEIDTQEVIALIRSIAGIDEAGLSVLVKSIFGLETSAPLPERLPLKFDLPTMPIAHGDNVQRLDGSMGD